jgi:hypothetical protein
MFLGLDILKVQQVRTFLSMLSKAGLNRSTGEDSWGLMGEPGLCLSWRFREERETVMLSAVVKEEEKSSEQGTRNRAL